MTTTRIARAKLTTHLRIIGTRADGYHLLDAEMVTLALADELTFADGDELVASGRWTDGVPRDDRNLIRRALAAVGRTAAVHVVKHIPPGGGLGGGSADAAAALAWAGCTDLALAARLGADVPFCLSGFARAHVGGIGEQLAELPFEARDYTLVLLPFGVDTAAAYRAWDELGGPTADGRNDLEPAAMAVEPRLAHWRDRITEAAGRAPTLAGSGATWFLEGAQPTIAAALTGATVVVTRTDRP